MREVVEVIPNVEEITILSTIAIAETGLWCFVYYLFFTLHVFSNLDLRKTKVNIKQSDFPAVQGQSAATKLRALERDACKVLMRSRGGFEVREAREAMARIEEIEQERADEIVSQDQDYDVSY
jgi:hypothetical protein